MAPFKKISVIGAGFSGICAAAVLAKKGHHVDVYEKHTEVGGRARQFEHEGFVFDMGPSWYWMPDVFEKFFGLFGEEVSDHYSLQRLDPAFTIFYGNDQSLQVPGNYGDLRDVFEEHEKGSAAKLDKYMEEAGFKYRVGMQKLVYRPGASWLEFMDLEVIRGAFRLDLFTSLRQHVRRSFKNPALVSLMEFPVLFLGGHPNNTPALYSLMNYAGLKLGTWYPMGGFGKVVDAMKRVAEKQGARFHLNSQVESLEFTGDRITHLSAAGISHTTDAVIATADYHHVEQSLLPKHLRSYSEKYWSNRVMAPSCLLFYLGLDQPVPRLQHHNLFFDRDMDKHTSEIYDHPAWPTDPLFYVCCPSKTDDSVAPKGKENLFVLMPLAAGLQDTEELREEYFNRLMERLEITTGSALRSHVIYKRSYCINDFKEDYSAYKGNAYGLANTLRQTAVLKPKMRSPNIRNLFYAGHLTVPGPGVPPAIISGQVAADLLNADLNALR